MRTKEQERSGFALGKTEDNIDKDTANFIVGAPTEIMTNGLGQAMAFWFSKGTDKHMLVFNTVKDWFVREGVLRLAQNGEAVNERVFFQKLSKANQNDYLVAQREALAVLQWLKRYARAFQER